MTVNDDSADAAPGRPTSIGFVGLGNMGAVMSARLVAAGFTVHGHDTSASARAALADAGGRSHDNLGDAVRDASLVILMLPSSDAVEAVARDPQFTPAAGTTVIDMGSSEPARTQALAAELGQREITLVDAPVSGGVAGARAAVCRRSRRGCRCRSGSSLWPSGFLRGPARGPPGSDRWSRR